MNITIKLICMLVVVLLNISTVYSTNIAESLCKYTQVDEKKRLRSFLKTNKLKIRRVFDGIQCNGKTLLQFADDSNSINVGKLLISKLPKNVVKIEMQTLKNEQLIIASKSRIE